MTAPAQRQTSSMGTTSRFVTRGIILAMPQWQALAERLRQHQIAFVIEPYIRFQGKPGEQATMFFLDPSGNALEFKAFAAEAAIFATDAEPR